jgi:hypothetical protein
MWSLATTSATSTCPTSTSAGRCGQAHPIPSPPPPPRGQQLWRPRPVWGRQRGAAGCRRPPRLRAVQPRASQTHCQRWRWPAPATPTILTPHTHPTPPHPNAAPAGAQHLVHLPPVGPHPQQQGAHARHAVQQQGVRHPRIQGPEHGGQVGGRGGRAGGGERGAGGRWVGVAGVAGGGGGAKCSECRTPPAGCALPAVCSAWRAVVGGRRAGCLHAGEGHRPLRPSSSAQLTALLPPLPPPSSRHQGAAGPADGHPARPQAVQLLAQRRWVGQGKAG